MFLRVTGKCRDNQSSDIKVPAEVFLCDLLVAATRPPFPSRKNKEKNDTNEAIVGRNTHCAAGEKEKKEEEEEEGESGWEGHAKGRHNNNNIESERSSRGSQSNASRCLSTKATQPFAFPLSSLIISRNRSSLKELQLRRSCNEKKIFSLFPVFRMPTGADSQSNAQH